MTSPEGAAGIRREQGKRELGILPEPVADNGGQWRMGRITVPGDDRGRKKVDERQGDAGRT